MSSVQCKAMQDFEEKNLIKISELGLFEGFAL